LFTLLFPDKIEVMTRYKATISYDGFAFAGFQRQPHARSVQEEIEKTLTRLNKGQAITVHGAGRTDSGVHALGQVIHFDLPYQMDEEKLRFALDTQSPEDIDVISIEIVADDFHCRYAKHSKTYEFIVDRGRPKNPMRRHYATHFPYPLDVERMQMAIKKLEGTHDFTGFTASGTSVEDKVRTITEASLSVDETGQFLTFTFAGNGFLYKQIRNMVGTLLKIGNNRMPVEQIDLILEKKDRQLAGPTAAPNGFVFKEISFEEKLYFCRKRNSNEAHLLGIYWSGRGNGTQVGRCFQCRYRVACGSRIQQERTRCPHLCQPVWRAPRVHRCAIDDRKPQCQCHIHSHSALGTRCIRHHGNACGQAVPHRKALGIVVRGLRSH